MHRREGLGSPRCHIYPCGVATRATSVLRLGSPLPHLRRLGSPLPRLRRLGSPLLHLHRDWAHPLEEGVLAKYDQANAERKAP